MIKSRGTLLFILGALAILVIVFVAYRLTFDSNPAAVPATSTPAAPPSVPASLSARVVRADGVVELRVGGGAWTRARAGATVDAGADVRTLRNGAAQLSYGDDIKLEVLPDTEVQLERMDEGVARFVVGEGVVVADVRPESGRVVQLAAKGSDAVAETRDGTLSMLSDGAGNVSAAVTRGEATLTAAGDTVKIPAGFQSDVKAGKAPGRPLALPKSLLLKVKWPDESTAKRRHIVSGTTSPGARVRVGDTLVTADAQGAFRAVVELHEGPNQVEVYAIDVIGRREDAGASVAVDTAAPKARFDTSPRMWGDPR